MRIDEIFSFEKGKLQSSKCVPGDFDFITASSDWKTHNEYTYECEALIFAAAASGSLGRTHYVNGKFVSSDLCFIITPKDQENLPIDLKFYHILFNEFKDEIVRNTKAGTSKEAIGLSSFGKYELPYFDIDTQIEIKNLFVNSEDIKSSLTTELNKQVGLVKKLRQQLLQDTVQGKLVEQNKKDEPANELLKKIKVEKEKLITEKKTKSEFKHHQKSKKNPPFELPDNWQWVRFSDIAWCFRGHNPSKIHFKKGPENGYVRFIQITDFKTDSQAVYVPISKKLKLVAKGEIVMAAYRHIGKFSREMEGAFNVALCKINNIEPFNRDYLSILIKSNLITGELLAASERGHIPSMHTEHLLSLWVPTPPLAEQNRIVQKFDELMQYCNELEASIKQSESQNEKLLQQVLRESLRQEPVITL